MGSPRQDPRSPYPRTWGPTIGVNPLDMFKHVHLGTRPLLR